MDVKLGRQLDPTHERLSAFSSQARPAGSSARQGQPTSDTAAAEGVPENVPT